MTILNPHPNRKLSTRFQLTLLHDEQFCKAFNSTVNEKITLVEKNLNQSVIAYQSECAKRHSEAQDDIKRLITDLENAQSAGTKELKDSFAKDLLDAKEQMKSFVTV